MYILLLLQSMNIYVQRNPIRRRIIIIIIKVCENSTRICIFPAKIDIFKIAVYFPQFYPVTK